MFRQVQQLPSSEWTTSSLLALSITWRWLPPGIMHNHPEDARSKHLWNVSRFLPDYMARHLRKESLSSHLTARNHQLLIACFIKWHGGSPPDSISPSPPWRWPRKYLLKHRNIFDARCSLSITKASICFRVTTSPVWYYNSHTSQNTNTLQFHQKSLHNEASQQQPRWYINALQMATRAPDDWTFSPPEQSPLKVNLNWNQIETTINGTSTATAPKQKLKYTNNSARPKAKKRESHDWFSNSRKS